MKMNIHSVTLNQDTTTDASTLICCLREILGELLFFSLDFFLGMRFLSLLKRSIIGGAKHRIASSTWSSNYSRTYTLLFHGTEEVLVQKKPLYYYNFGPTALLIYEIKARRKEPKKIIFSSCSSSENHIPNNTPFSTQFCTEQQQQYSLRDFRWHKGAIIS